MAVTLGTFEFQGVTFEGNVAASIHTHLSHTHTYRLSLSLSLSFSLSFSLFLSQATLRRVGAN